MRGLGRLFRNRNREGETWRFSIWHYGRRIVESTGTSDRFEAEAYRMRRLRELTPLGGRPNPDATVNDLLDLVEKEARTTRRVRDPENVRHKLSRVRSRLGIFKPHEITTELLEYYQAERLQEGFSDWTIAEDLRLLKRALVLGIRTGVLADERVLEADPVPIDWQQRLRRSRRSEILEAQRPPRVKKPREPKPEPPIPPPVTEARTVKDLLDTHYRDLRLNGRKTVHYWHHSKRIVERFGPMSPQEVRVIHIETYKQERLQAGAKPATVNNELAILRRAFKLGQQLELIERAPFVRMLRTENARQGFLTVEEYHKLRSTLEILSPPAADALVIWFCLGWRRQEVLGLTWSDVDLEAETIRLPAARSKNREPRPVKIGGGILEGLRRRWADRRGEYVFHRRGNPIVNFRGPWKRATAAIGRPELFIHDLRRSFAKAALEAGLSTADIMTIAGWKTIAMFLRYGLLFDAKRLGTQVAVLDAHVAKADGFKTATASRADLQA